MSGDHTDNYFLRLCRDQREAGISTSELLEILRAENAKLTAELALVNAAAVRELHDRLDAMTKQRDELRAEVERLRTALKYYAYANYGSVALAAFDHKPHIYDDHGERARAALAGKDEPK